ncbi:MAG: hypothetical protein WCS94_22875 [Verrucomicrobiota bacterium]
MQPESHNGKGPEKNPSPPVFAASSPPVLPTPVRPPPVLSPNAVPPALTREAKPDTKPAPPIIPLQPKTTISSKTQKSTGIKSRKIIFGIIIIGVVGLFGLVLITLAASKKNPRNGFTSSSTLFTKDTPEDFIILCETLFEKIKLEGAVLPSEAEARIKEESCQAEITGISQRGKDLGKIAQGLIYLESKRQGIAANAPNGKAFVSGLPDLASGLKNESGADMWNGLLKMLPDIASGAKTILGAMDLMEQKHMLAIILANKCAPQFSGLVTNGSLLKCSFAEHKPIFFEPSMIQQLGLVNASGRDLHNCVVFVRASDADGKSYVNIHFAQNWPKEGNLVAQYKDTDSPNPTVENTTRVDVTVWTSEISFEPVTLVKPASGWLEPK